MGNAVKNPSGQVHSRTQAYQDGASRREQSDSGGGGFFTAFRMTNLLLPRYQPNRYLRNTQYAVHKRRDHV